MGTPDFIKFSSWNLFPSTLSNFDGNTTIECTSATVNDGALCDPLWSSVILVDSIVKEIQ